jgi:hypothetical protein
VTKTIEEIIDVDFHLNELEDELVVSIRTTNGVKLHPQDIVDAIAEVVFEYYGHSTPSITAEEIANDESLN